MASSMKRQVVLDLAAPTVSRRDANTRRVPSSRRAGAPISTPSSRMSASVRETMATGPRRHRHYRTRKAPRDHRAPLLVFGRAGDGIDWGAATAPPT